MKDLKMNALSEDITRLIDKALQQEDASEPPRSYLGASRLGEECARALQFEYFNTPKDEGENFTGRILRIFQAGHVYESLLTGWIRKAGIELITNDNKNNQFGFAALDGKLCGHIDGVIVGGPVELGFSPPMLWESKSLNNASWKDTVRKGLTLSKPVYAGQIALYQAYMEPRFPGIHKQSALFTAINKDTAELYFEAVPFNGELAQRCSDKGLRIIDACEAKELLPRISREPSHFKCKMCAWQKRCWSAGNE